MAGFVAVVFIGVVVLVAIKLLPVIGLDFLAKVYYVPEGADWRNTAIQAKRRRKTPVWAIWLIGLGIGAMLVSMVLILI